jgi:Stage II sporulation protein M
MMEVNSLVLVRGLRDTRQTLVTWNLRPWGVIGRWALGAVATAFGLLCATWIVARVVTPDPTVISMPGIGYKAGWDDVGHVLYRNSLVLALHAMACVAGFIAGSSLPLEAENYTGIWRKIHDHAGRLAIGFVVCATTFSLCTQAYVLGNGASTISSQLGISPALLLVGVLPHALPELTALFLPLAAWIIASRRGDWHELLAATFVTVAIAAPVLVISAMIEIFVSPHVLVALAG